MEEKEVLNQDQVYDLITSEELSWQSIIYDLVKTEQLDPWNIDIGVLADSYLKTIQEMEDADFFVSSKVLLACSLLLRLKSEILLNKHLQGLDEALYGKQEEKRYELERIELDENELPILVPRTPMARHRKVTLKELISSLNKAIETENRRIKKEIKGRQAKKSALVVMPNTKRIPLKTRIKCIFAQLSKFWDDKKSHMAFSHIAPSKEEKLASFVPVLHLSNNNKIFIHQKAHFEELLLGLEMHPEEKEILANQVGLNLEKNDEPEYLHESPTDNKQ